MAATRTRDPPPTQQGPWEGGPAVERGGRSNLAWRSDVDDAPDHSRKDPTGGEQGRLRRAATGGATLQKPHHRRCSQRRPARTPWQRRRPSWSEQRERAWAQPAHTPESARARHLPERSGPSAAAAGTPGQTSSRRGFSWPWRAAGRAPEGAAAGTPGQTSSRRGFSGPWPAAGRAPEASKSSGRPAGAGDGDPRRATRPTLTGGAGEGSERGGERTSRRRRIRARRRGRRADGGDQTGGGSTARVAMASRELLL